MFGVFIDAENVQTVDVLKKALDVIENRFGVQADIIKVYADWSLNHVVNIKEYCQEHNLLMHNTTTSESKQNSSDLELCLDVYENIKDLDIVVLVSNDSDFTRLSKRILALGKECINVRTRPCTYENLFTEVIYLDNFIAENNYKIYKNFVENFASFNNLLNTEINVLKNNINLATQSTNTSTQDICELKKFQQSHISIHNILNQKIESIQKDLEQIKDKIKTLNQSVDSLVESSNTMFESLNTSLTDFIASNQDKNKQKVETDELVKEELKEEVAQVQAKNNIEDLLSKLDLKEFLEDENINLSEEEIKAEALKACEDFQALVNADDVKAKAYQYYEDFQDLKDRHGATESNYENANNINDLIVSMAKEVYGDNYQKALEENSSLYVEHDAVSDREIEQSLLESERAKSLAKEEIEIENSAQELEDMHASATENLENSVDNISTVDSALETEALDIEHTSTTNTDTVDAAQEQKEEVEDTEGTDNTDAIQEPVDAAQEQKEEVEDTEGTDNTDAIQEPVDAAQEQKEEVEDTVGADNEDLIKDEEEQAHTNVDDIKDNLSLKSESKETAAAHNMYEDDIFFSLFNNNAENEKKEESTLDNNLVDDKALYANFFASLTFNLCSKTCNNIELYVSLSEFLSLFNKILISKVEGDIDFPILDLLDKKIFSIDGDKIYLNLENLEYMQDSLIIDLNKKSDYSYLVSILDKDLLDLFVDNNNTINFYYFIKELKNLRGLDTLRLNLDLNEDLFNKVNALIFEFLKEKNKKTNVVPTKSIYDYLNLQHKDFVTFYDLTPKNYKDFFIKANIFFIKDDLNKCVYMENDFKDYLLNKGHESFLKKTKKDSQTMDNYIDFLKKNYPSLFISYKVDVRDIKL